MITFQPAPRKAGFEFVHDLAVAAYRAIEPLQVAVDDKNQVVELLARTERERTQGLGLVRLAVAHEGPNLARSLLDQAAVLQVAHEARLVNRVQRANPHRHCREPPEIFHQPGVRVRRQSRRVTQFVAEVLDLLFAQPTLEKGARVHARRGVALEINQIARFVAVTGVEEVVESDFEQGGERRIGRDVAADAGIFLVLAMHHGHRIPADQALDAALQLAVAGIRNFFRGRNGIQVGRVELDGDIDAGRSRVLDDCANQFSALVGAFLVHDLIERLNPFGDFFFVVCFRLNRKLDQSIQ